MKIIIRNEKKERLAKALFVSLILATLFFLILLFLSEVSEKIAAISYEYICRPTLVFSSRATEDFGAPVFEILIFSSPFIIAYLVVWSVREFPRFRVRLLLFFLISTMLVTYTASLGIPSNLPSKTLHGGRGISQNDFVFAANSLVFTLNDKDAYQNEPLADIYTGFDEAMKAAAIELGAPTYVPRVKTSLIPEILCKANILAYYSFPTTEIIINSYVPRAKAVFCAAHEIMHFFGVSREDEADFFAFKFLYLSGNPYLRYCAALSAYEYVSEEIRNTSPHDYLKLFSSLPKAAVSELSRIREFSENSSRGRLKILSNKANDAVISLRDSRGAESYSNSVALIVSYLNSVE